MSESFDYNPLSRREAFLAAIAGDPDTVPVPMSRREELLAAIADRLDGIESRISALESIGGGGLDAPVV